MAILDVSSDYWRVVSDRDVRYSFYIGGYVITNLKTLESRATNVRPNTYQPLRQWNSDMADLFRQAHPIKE